MNTVLVTVDALRADHLSQYGYDRRTMPVVDRLLDDGVVFEQAFANGPYTRISVPSFHTSRYLGYEEIHDSPTIASVLGETGVKTAGFGTQAGLDKVDMEGDLIFDTYVDFGQDEYKDRTEQKRPLRDRVMNRIAEHDLMDDPRVHRLAKSLYDQLPLAVGNPTPTAGYTSAERVTDGAIEWLTDNGDDEFFLWLHYMEAHRPYGIHDDAHEFVEGSVDVESVNAIARKAGVRPDSVTDEEQRLLVNLYDSDLRYCSRQLDRLIEEMRSLGLWDETNVLFSSDHGEGFGEHGHYFHRYQPYDELIHVPLVVRGPDVPDRDPVAGQRELIDLAPTICEWHGVDVSELPFEGKHLFAGDSRHVMAVGSQLNDDAVVAGRWGGWKYMSVEGEQYLFDLEADPGEQRSVADDHPERVAEFREEIPDRLFHQAPETLSVPDDDDRRRERLEALGYLEVSDE